MITVGWRAYVAGAPDAHGNPTAGYDAEVPLEVLAVYPPGTTSTDEPEPGRDETTTDLIVLTYPGDVEVRARDRLVIDGAEFEVDGDPSDWGRGPYGWRPGAQITLKRAEG